MTLSVPGLIQTQSSEPQAPKADLCRQTEKLSWWGGNTGKDGKPLYAVTDLQKITAMAVPVDEMAARLRNWVGDTSLTIIGIKQFNARRAALCDPPKPGE